MTIETLNSLSKASSAYLRSAMHQPIHWHEWGEEAFATAQRENKPVLLDIGAVWCHWCHVMDRESYDDPEVAAIVNEHFIAVKVDRDERPSFKRVLTSIANAYKEKHGDIVEQAKMVESAIAQSESFAGRSGHVSLGVIDGIEKSALAMFDARNGGFGQAPKFPHSSAIDLLIEQHVRTTSGASLRPI